MIGRVESYSSLQILQSCERRYGYRYLEDLERFGSDPWAPIRGKAWHAIVAALLIDKGRREKTLLRMPEKIELWDEFDVELHPQDGLEYWIRVLEQVELWESQLGLEKHEEMVAEYGAPLSIRLIELKERYLQRWDGLKNEKVLLVEQEWTRETPGGVGLRGRADAVVLDTEIDAVVVRDSKTVEKWSSYSRHVDDIQRSQLFLNAWGIAPAIRELTNDEMYPQAVEYDRVKFKKPTWPKLTLKGALSKSVSDYDLYTYKEFCCSEEAINLGYQYDQEVADRVSVDKDAWFRRDKLPLNMNAVAAHVMAAEKQAKRARQILTIDDAGISPGENCSRCPYSQLCRAELYGGRLSLEEVQLSDYGLRKRL